MNTTTLDLSADIIDVRDIIERIEGLAHDLTTYTAEASAHPELAEEHAALCAIMEQLKGNGGDEQWHGDWYPLALIHERHFTDYCREQVTDCGILPDGVPWWIEIDWAATARNMMIDYSIIEIDGSTYYFR